jgi:DNA repair photolyase
MDAAAIKSYEERAASAEQRLAALESKTENGAF